MRLHLMRIALLFGAFLLPASVYGNDGTIAKQLTTVLQEAKSEGDLSGFKLSVKVEDGTVWMSGKVADVQQRELALDKARRVSGVKLVVNDIEIDDSSVVRGPVETEIGDTSVTQASAQRAVRYRNESYDYPAPSSRPRRQVRRVEVAPPVPVSRSARRISSRPTRQPQRESRVQYEQEIGGYVDGGIVGGEIYGDSYGGSYDGGYTESYPVESYGGGGSTYQLGQPTASSGGYGGGYDGGSGGYENAQLPGYAWPSYAAHPNYAGVSYPKQYSAAAWPYIGPFYPYPQVPMGWRKVSLEWDDGWWMLDFKSK